MKKIPTLFERVYENHKVVGITDRLTDPSFIDVLDGKCITTIKFDGTCCAVINGIVYKRFDAKAGRKVPDGAIPCCDPDPITGHYPHWLALDCNSNSDKYIKAAFMNTSFCVIDGATLHTALPDGTYEAVGFKINGNPYNMDSNKVIKHGSVSYFDKNTKGKWTFESIKSFLKDSNIEGFVFWKDGEPICKIKRTDFGFQWPIKNNNIEKGD